MIGEHCYKQSENASVRSPAVHKSIHSVFLALINMKRYNKQR